mmetsp:Transcript_38174/g.81382  ORF Transcript_38174/g.81382 Transcript_38174/m.81382 type:complete len:204 (+) Transcript_38174:863-1474(+)
MVGWCRFDRRLYRLFGALVEGDAARPVEREQHETANDGERLEEVVAIEIAQALVNRPEGIHEKVAYTEHDGEQHCGVLGLEADADEDGEAEEEEREEDGEEARLGEDLVEATVLGPESLEEEEEGEQQAPEELEPVGASILGALWQPHVLVAALTVVLAPYQKQQSASKREAAAHKIHIRSLSVHERLHADEREEAVARRLHS